ncbi:unnamed protein product [Cyprideis torosa]|uniref:Uncharacterized protein n=1 Tax=Cyprideis torosa TaxID=163714 RepID=A0A7R8ZSA4_9CRUS|nr:unnamed protein product [Cyprideis torosa]CAG0895682.1 unnamed protein product [Cyprideis torosa]
MEEEEVVFQGSGLDLYLRDLSEHQLIPDNATWHVEPLTYQRLEAKKVECDVEIPVSDEVLEILKTIVESNCVLKEDVRFVYALMNETKAPVCRHHFIRRLARFSWSFCLVPLMFVCPKWIALPAVSTVTATWCLFLWAERKQKASQLKRLLNFGSEFLSVGRSSVSLLQEMKLAEQGFDLFPWSLSSYSSLPLAILLRSAFLRWERSLVRSQVLLRRLSPLPSGCETPFMDSSDDLLDGGYVDDNVELSHLKKLFSELRVALSSFWRRLCLSLLLSPRGLVEVESVLSKLAPDWSILGETTQALKKALVYNRTLCLPSSEKEENLRQSSCSIEARALLDCRVNLRVALGLLSVEGENELDALLEESESRILSALDSIRLWKNCHTRQEVAPRSPRRFSGGTDTSPVIPEQAPTIATPIVPLMTASPIEVDDELYEGHCEHLTVSAKAEVEWDDEKLEAGAVLRELKQVLKGKVIPDRLARERAVRERKGLGEEEMEGLGEQLKGLDEEGKKLGEEEREGLSVEQKGLDEERKKLGEEEREGLGEGQEGLDEEGKKLGEEEREGLSVEQKGLDEEGKKLGVEEREGFGEGQKGLDEEGKKLGVEEREGLGEEQKGLDEEGKILGEEERKGLSEGQKGLDEEGKKLGVEEREGLGEGQKGLEEDGLGGEGESDSCLENKELGDEKQKGLGDGTCLKYEKERLTAAGDDESQRSGSGDDHEDTSCPEEERVTSQRRSCDRSGDTSSFSEEKERKILEEEPSFEEQRKALSDDNEDTPCPKEVIRRSHPVPLPRLRKTDSEDSCDGTSRGFNPLASEVAARARLFVGNSKELVYGGNGD